MPNEPTGFIGPYGQPSQQANPTGPLPAPVAPQVPDRGFGSGAFIRIHLTPPNLQHQRPAWTIDGSTQMSEWGTQVIPVAPGRHRVGGGYAVNTQQSKSIEVEVAPGQTVDVYWAPGTFSSKIALQPVKPGQAISCIIGAIVLAVTFGGVLLVIFAVIVIVAVIRS